MTDHARPVSRPWRRFLRVSVRGMIVLVIVVGAGLGWIVRRAHIQRDAVAAIRKAGGALAYSWDPKNGFASAGPTWAPGWLLRLSGADFFGHVAAVNLRGSLEQADATLVEVGRLNQLQRLWLDDASVTDAGLVHLEGLTTLSFLTLQDTQITDAGLVHLKRLTNLSALELNGTQVTDAGLVHLKGLTNLIRLSLSRTRVTDAGLVHLKRLTNLSTLELNGTQVTDAGLVHLKGLTNLTTLELAGTQVTDAGVKEIQEALPKLKITR